MDEKDKGEREAQSVEELSAHGVPAQLGSDVKDQKKGGQVNDNEKNGGEKKST